MCALNFDLGYRLPVETKSQLPQINRDLERATPREIIRWAWSAFGETMISSSSFQTQSIPLLYFISQEAPQIPVVFVDTGFHFAETIAFRDRVVEMFGLTLKIVQPQIKGEDFLRIFGPLYNQSPDACCFYNKVAPFQLYLKNYRAWISGIRRDQTDNRQNSPVIGQHPFLSLYKINPMAGWTAAQIDDFIEEHDLPRHPLWYKGYRSIGCEPCTLPVDHDEDERAGRWANFEKTECGMHI